MRGELSSGKHAKRHPYDWYVEEEWVTRQLIAAIGFDVERERGDAIWDPSVGSGRALAAAQSFSLDVIGSDIVNRIDPALFDGAALPRFFSADFLEVDSAPARCSIICNSPYSYRNGSGAYAGMLISEAFARHAIKLVKACGGQRVCMLLPSKWLASQRRYSLFTTYPPAAVLHLTQRPSMPPGDRIAAMGNRAFRGGMVDYCWIVWDVQHPTPRGETRTIWLPPLAGAEFPTTDDGDPA